MYEKIGISYVNDKADFLMQIKKRINSSDYTLNIIILK